MLQFAAAKGKTQILQLLLNHGYFQIICLVEFLKPNDPFWTNNFSCDFNFLSRVGPDGNGDSPSAMDFAASCGRVEAFVFLAERLGTDQDSDWFGLRQVCAFT